VTHSPLADPIGPAHPATRVFRGTYTPAMRREAADFVRARGEALRPVYVALCIACWLRDHAGRDAVCGADVRALFPTSSDGERQRLRSPTDLLRRARNDGFLDSAGAGWYRVTALGRAVVDALPDLGAMESLVGRATARCAARRRQGGTLRLDR